jgi:hypothetical protein
MLYSTLLLQYLHNLVFVTITPPNFNFKIMLRSSKLQRATLNCVTYISDKLLSTARGRGGGKGSVTTLGGGK